MRLSLMLLFAARLWCAMPDSLKITLDSCAGEPFMGIAKLQASGVVTSTEGYWQAVTVRVVATVKNGITGATQDIRTLIGVVDIYENTPKAFTADFPELVQMSKIQSLQNCTWSFGGGARILRKPKLVASTGTPISKDEDCFADFLKARQLKGLEERKKIAELVQYGCLITTTNDAVVDISRKFSVDSAGVKIRGFEGIFRQWGGGDQEWHGISSEEYLTVENVPINERIAEAK